MKDMPRRPAPNRDSGRATSRSQAKSRPPRTRAERTQELAQDYVKVIAGLIATTGEARVIDVARQLGVTHVTVGRTVQRLQRDGWVTSLPYRSIFLTEAGRRLAEESGHRHQIVVTFLKSLGVPDAVAEVDAEGMEHHVSPETLAAFRKHTGNID